MRPFFDDEQFAYEIRSRLGSAYRQGGCPGELLATAARNAGPVPSRFNCRPAALRTAELDTRSHRCAGGVMGLGLCP
jgi:hypothetical protein